MTSTATITFLGTGTSQGIPMIGCECPVCTSLDFRDKRFRSSIHIDCEGTSIVIDSGPDFRLQMLQNRVKHLDAIVFTHEHKDHIAGLDDVRGFNFKQKRPMPLYGEKRVLDRLQVEFAYAFGDNTYPGVPQLTLHKIQAGKPFYIQNLRLEPFHVMHHMLPVMGFRVGDLVYITDAKTIAFDQMDWIRGARILIVNGLQKEHHISHFTLQEALDFINEINPEMAYLTHISHRLGLHATVEAQDLPPNVKLAYDGLKLKANVRLRITENHEVPDMQSGS